MVIPWAGYLAVEAARGGRAARQTRSTSRSRRCIDPKRMPEPEQHRGARRGRTSRACGMDEAMHPLALLATGLYGAGAAAAGRRAGAARRAVEVRLQGHQVDRQDHARRQAAADDVEHARAATSTASTPTSTRTTITRAGARRPSSASASRAAATTLMFNGYADQVASLYAGHGSRCQLLSRSSTRRFAKRLVIVNGLRAGGAARCGTRVTASARRQRASTSRSARRA